MDINKNELNRVEHRISNSTFKECVFGVVAIIVMCLSLVGVLLIGQEIVSYTFEAVIQEFNK